MIDFGSPACSPHTPILILLLESLPSVTDDETSLPTVFSSTVMNGSISKIFFSTYSPKNFEESSLDKPSVVWVKSLVP